MLRRWIEQKQNFRVVQHQCEIITSTANEDEENAYFEAVISPKIIQLKNELTRKLFTRRQRSCGNYIAVGSFNLQSASLKTKLNFAGMVDRGAMLPNEWRESLGLAPVPGGDTPLRRLDTVAVDEGGEMMPKTIDIKGPIITNDDKWIYDWFGVASCCPADIRSQLDEVADDEGVQVVINSSGGDIFAASEIYDMLAESKATIKVVFAASAASYIACACKSEIVPTGMLMIHNVSSYAVGDYNDMAHESGVLLKASKAVATAYRLKTGMSEDELIGLMDKETWLTADEAVEKVYR